MTRAVCLLMSVMDYLNPFGFFSERFARDIVDMPENGKWDGDTRLNENGAGVEFGYGNGAGDSKVLGGRADVGTWTDKDGAVYNGANAEIGGYKTGASAKQSGMTILGQDMSWDFGLGTANAGVYDKTYKGEDGLTRRTESAGASANAIEGSLTAGNDAGGVRFGLSHGGGAAARRHMVDIDGDGEMEMNGFGLDVGPVSFDVKSDMIAELIKDAPDLDVDLEDIWNVPDMIANPDDYEMPSLDDYEMPSLDNLPSFDDYELPELDLPDLSLPEVPDWVPDIFGGGSGGGPGGGGGGGGGGECVAPEEIPTGLLDLDDPLMNPGAY
ncbi:MAG: hypothetical protein ACKV2T_07360 [Kofleriaceae bacterium]